MPPQIDPKIPIPQSDLEALMRDFYALTNSEDGVGAAERITEAIRAYHAAEQEMYGDYLAERGR